jgi:serine/threonine-protein kinase
VEALASPQIIGRYGLYGKIASGGMASVHFGRLLGAAGFSRTVAIKRLHLHLAEDPEFLATMIDEARLAARIHHPNVVPTLDVVAAEGELLVVMEYVRGESLARLCRTVTARAAVVPTVIASAIALGVLQGLHAAHEATTDRGEPLGIVHRDVSPQNILVGVDGMARIIDFGVAKAAGRLQTTREGVVKGKMAYMAPEQVAAQEVTRSSDVYALSVVLWEMLTGKRLFQADNDAARATLVLRGTDERPSLHVPDLPPALDALVMKGLALRPADRFATAQEMADALLRIVQPAFPTEVGKWVQELAEHDLAKRGALLAEIESSSGMPSAVRPESKARQRDLGADGQRSAVRPERAREGLEEAPTAVTQPSSLSVENPRSTVLARRRSHGVLVGALGACVLLLAGLSLGLWRRSPAPSGTAATSAPAAAAGPKGSAVAPASAPTAPPPASASAASPPAAPSSIPASTPEPIAPSRTAAPPPHASPRAAPPVPTRPKDACNPPYVIDSLGDRQYKPECL